MSPEISKSKSPLERPLHQLTEDDISQLTREDCRRYLKEKGMRRPSWNKSQAIQQVISLKALLETTLDSGSGYRRKLYNPRDYADVQRANTDTKLYELAEKTMPDGRKQQEKPDLFRDMTVRPVAVNETTCSRTIGSVDTPVGQMTIFYSGKVNVYDDVPADKAQTIMHLASSVPSETPSNATIAARHSACRLQAANTNCDTMLLPITQTVKTSDVSQLHVDECNNLYEGNTDVKE